MHALEIIDLLVENFKMRYNDHSDSAIHVCSSAIPFAFEVCDASEDVQIE
jgi:hypothetical protein